MNNKNNKSKGCVRGERMTSDEKEQAVKSKQTVLTKRRQDTDTKNTMTFRQFCLPGMKKKKKD